MLKFLIGAWLLTTTVLAQTSPQAAKPGSTKPAANSTASKSAKQTSASAKTPSNTKTSSTSSSQPVSAARMAKPIPQPPLSENLESKDNAIPSYKKVKSKGQKKGIERDYSPRRTASGARVDTMNRRKP